MFRALVLLALLLFTTGSTNADDLPKGVVNTQNPKDVSLSPAESLKRISVPDGFHVTLFAGEPDLRRPIAFDFDDRGRLWVVENYSHPVWKKDRAIDRILIFEDSDNDGQFDQRKVFWDKGRYLTGIAVGHGGVWIGNTPELSFIPDRNHDDFPDSESVVILDGFQKSTNNVLNNFHWGPDGWLYGAIGLSNASMVGKPGSAKEDRVRITRGIWRFHPVRYKFEVVAEGMVNPWGADFNEYGDLFTSNTVLAHLWHIVPGMYCERRAAERDNPYVYQRIQSITNHLHWGGGTWQSSRKHDENHSVAGGGHAHCGAMIYLADNWPEKYRGTFFTNNLHGNRVNNDWLVAKNSTYVGVHADDFLFGNDPWFRGMSIKYGADGGVYVSDWHDFGECHDSDGSHRTSGRIYKVVYGNPTQRQVDLQKLTSVQLADLHLNTNEWFVRHARRILHERAVAGNSLDDAKEQLLTKLNQHDNEVVKLRALWTLFVIGKLQESELISLLTDQSPHLRRWAVRLLVDQTHPNESALTAMTELAKNDASPIVRLALACALQRLPLSDRWEIADGLISHAVDVSDPYLPLMIWYGVEPLVKDNTQAALKLAARSTIPLIRQFIARRTLDAESPPIEIIVDAALKAPNENARLDFLRGMLEVLDGRAGKSAPPNWKSLSQLASKSSNPTARSVIVRLATIFGDEQAIASLRDFVLNKQSPSNDRRDAFRALTRVENGLPVSLLHRLAAEPSNIRRDALQTLTVHNNPTTAAVVLDLYPKLEGLERQDAIGVLGTRRTFATALIAAIEEEKVDRKDVSAFALQQLRSFQDSKLKKRIDAIWADDAQQLQKSDEIARYKKRMTPQFLKSGDAHVGRTIFEQNCAKCHVLFGEGARVGPDLTGSGRKKLDYVLSNLVDPNAVIDPAYRLTKIVTTDGRLYSGFLIQQDDKFVTVRTQEARIRLAMKDVEELRSSKTSMMPEGMLRKYSDEQVRDLILYLASPEQVPRASGRGE